MQMQQAPTKEQFESAAKQLEGIIALTVRTVELKKLKRRGILLQAKADAEMIDIELVALDEQVKGLEQARKQNEEASKQAQNPSMILSPFPKGL